jgi:zinc protease
MAPGTGALAVDLMSEGTTTRTGAQLVEQFNALGATFGVSGGGEITQLGLSALKPTLPQAIALYADVVQHPAFAPSDVERLKVQTIVAIESGRLSPNRIASRLLPRLIYEVDSPYGRLSSEPSARAITRDDLGAFHHDWFRPNNATLVVVGDTTLAEIRPMIEKGLPGGSRALCPPPSFRRRRPPASR